MSPNITRFGFAEGPSRRGFKGAGGFVLDMSEVQARMALLNNKVLPSRIKRGLMVAGTKFMTDIVIMVPTAPIRRPDYVDPLRRAGELRASGALFVDGVKRGTTVKYGETAMGRYQPVKYGGTPLTPMSHEACVVFNAPYAATQHESFPKKSEDMAGTHYMSEKLYGNSVEYIAIIARAIRL